MTSAASKQKGTSAKAKSEPANTSAASKGSTHDDADVDAGDPTRASTAEAFIVGLVGPIAALVLFVNGHGAIDRADPAIDQARMWYITTVVVGLGMVAALWRNDPDRFWQRALIAGVCALPVGYYVGAIGRLYGFDGVWFVLFLFYYALPVLGTFLLVIAIVSAVLASQGKPRMAATGAIVGGAALGVGIAGAAAYHLFTLTSQAEDARAAHEETPGLGIVAVLAALVLALVVRRHRTQR